MEEDFDIWKQEPCYISAEFDSHAIKMSMGVLIDIRCNLHCFYSRRFYQHLKKQIFILKEYYYD